MKKLVQGLILSFSIVISADFAVKLHVISGMFPLIWPPIGVGLAGLVLLDESLWPWIAFSTVLVTMSRHIPLSAGIPIGLICAFENLLSAHYLKKFLGPRPTLSKLREVVVFILVVLVITNFVATAFKVEILYLSGYISKNYIFETWRGWALASAIGSLVIGGCLINWANDETIKLQKILKKKWEFLILYLTIAFICVVNFTPLGNRIDLLILRPYILFSLISWAASRFDTFGVTLSNLLIFTIAVFGTTMNYSPFINFLGEQRLGVLQVFLGVLATSGMFLAAAVREKDEAVEARNEFLAIASHELKTPLTTLGLQVYLSAKKFKESGSEMVFGKIEGQVQRLGRIVEQLLDVSRFDRKTIRMNYDHLELKNFIERTVENHAEDLRKAGCTVKLNLENPINCCWDSFRIEQVFENILSNCIKYAPQSPIEVTARKDEEFATIQIRDRGPGIDKTRQHYVFDRFVRASGATHVDGLGLGLYITRQIVLGHNGKIWIDCPQGKGCTVSIRIPLRPINAVIAAVESSTSFEINSRIRSD